jgi:integration host factor subunit alpha
MRINLTKKDLTNAIYMQIGFSKKISENLIDDFFLTIIENLKKEKKLKIAKFGTFTIRGKKSRIGRNPLTKEKKIISERNVVLFKASKEFKDLINSNND